MTLNTDTCLHLFSLQFITSSTHFGTPKKKKKKCAQLLYLTFTNCLKKDFVCVGKIFQTYKRVFLVDKN